MEEIASRFSKESGSEEITIPERECEDPHGDSRQEDSIDYCIDGNEDVTEHISSTQQPRSSTQSSAQKKQTATTRTKDTSFSSTMRGQ